ncbi:hypothetical protein NPIL_675741 [Nephila pilipes]|uniref:Uncharacterized protein n=1 Tax=Nephila pilipes TaxID=299642 RepID=A0A8X6THZ1_NEPPI|nr:hypothetical protein NPIL_675741 [Nephila pilipes]
MVGHIGPLWLVTGLPDVLSGYVTAVKGKYPKICMARIILISVVSVPNEESLHERLRIQTSSSASCEHFKLTIAV